MAIYDVEGVASSHLGRVLCVVVVRRANSSLFSLNAFRGIFSTAMAGVRKWSEAMAFRFLLGVFEAGYGPGIPYLLSFFYLRKELGVRIGFFLAAAVSIQRGFLWWTDT